jgi:hypothetical protein
MFIPKKGHKMKLKRIGFFQELPYGSQNDLSIYDIQKASLVDEDKILQYLQSAVLFVAAPGVEKDVLSSSKRIIGSVKIFTDGIWAWPASLYYYLENYHIVLPEEFLEYVRNKNYMHIGLQDLVLSDLELVN